MDKISQRETVGKRAIIKVLKDNADKHLTFEDIKSLLDEGGYSVGQATIYRQLKRLEQAGMVNKYINDRQAACYQYLEQDCLTHCHAMCTRCGKMLHIESQNFLGIKDKIKSEEGFEMNVSRTMIYGLCRKCALTR